MAPDELEEARVLGRRWAREVASAEELDVALDAADGGGAPFPASAATFLAEHGSARLAAAGSRSAELAAAFLDGVATSEGEE